MNLMNSEQGWVLELAKQMGLSDEQIAIVRSGDWSAAMKVAGVDPADMPQGFGFDAPAPPRRPTREARGRDPQQRLMRRLRATEQALSLQLDRVERLAEILGACTCFGLDEGCPDCAGEGAPGAFESDDPAQLRDWLAGVCAALGLPLGTPGTEPMRERDEHGTVA